MHFLVIVIGEHPADQLAPYQENNLGTCPQEYLEFNDVEDEFRDEYLFGSWHDPRAKADDPSSARRRARDVFATFDDYMDAVYGERDERTGRYGDWFNPNAEYDWYVFGGRFYDYLRLKSPRPGWLSRLASTFSAPERIDQARKKDLDFGAMSRACYARHIANWKYLEQRGSTDDRLVKCHFDIPETVTTRKQIVGYARKRAVHNAPDRVLFDGEWFGPWWARNDQTEEEAERWDSWFTGLLTSLSDDTLLTAIDCHV